MTMSCTHTFGNGPFDLVHHLAGRVSLEGLLECRRTLLDDPRFRPGLTVLYDFTEIEAVDLSGEDVRQLAADATLARVEFRAAAIAARTDDMFGFARMFMTVASPPGHRTARTVVRSVAEAEAWLAELNDAA